MKKIIFLIQCPDQKGLLANITSFFYDLGLNILHCQQHTDTIAERYFMRIELDMKDLVCSRKDLRERFGTIAKRFRLDWSVHFTDRVPKVALLVSKAPHCLYDVILRWEERQLRCEIPLIISNHPDLEYVAEQFQIPFHCLPMRPGGKEKQEKEVLALLKKHHVDLIVLARYMQILSPNFIGEHAGRIINIHHAFLPAFQGANPYQRAYERGVKMIGATAHYATAELDQGPIIEQDVQRVSHDLRPEELKAIGRDVECLVLSRAVRGHLENRILIHENRTVVF